MTSGMSIFATNELDEAATASAAWRHRSEQIQEEFRHAARGAKRSQTYGFLRSVFESIKSGLKRIFGDNIFRWSKEEL
jgi:hypothetical protein